MADKKKKPPKLSLNPTSQPAHNTDSPDGGGFAVDTTSTEIEEMNETVKKMEITDDQRRNLGEFLEEKKKIVAEGEMKEHHLQRLEELGFGNGGVVLKVQHKPTGIIMARKVIMLDIKPAVRSQIMRELKILHECNCPYIVGFYGNFCLNNEISICMEHMDGGSVDLIMNAGRIPVDVIANITNSVLQGLKYLREIHKIMHRDVKPSNILVNTHGEIKLCDFGVSGQLINSMANSFVGTRSYMAPERLQGSQYSVLSDIWSLGVSLVEMAIGRYPIPQPSLEDIAEEMKLRPAGELPPREGGNNFASHANAIRMPIFELLQIITVSEPPALPAEHFPEKFRNFVDLCLFKDEKKRGELGKLLEQPFVMKHNLMSTKDFAAWVERIIEANRILKQQEGNN